MEEKHLLSAILEKTHEAIIAVDENQIIIKCNQRMMKLMNSTSEKVIGMSIKTMLPGFDNDKEISNYEFETQKKNFIVRAEKMLMEGKTLKVYFFSDNHFNIELGNRYAEMKVLVDTYESILNSIDEGIHVADIDGNIKYINPSQQRLDGLTDAVIGKHWTEVYDLDDDTSLVLKALNEAKYTYDEYQNYVTRGGKYVSIVCSAMPIFSENKIIGAIGLADVIKEASYRAVTDLHNMGIKVAMLTGDNKAVAENVAEKLAIDTYFAEVLPEDKYKKIKELQEQGNKVMMVGDGVNDAPALTQADVGVAIGAGTEVAVEAGNIVLMRNNPQDIVTLVILSKKVHRKMVQNLYWAFGYNIVAIPAAAGVFAAWGIFLRPEIGVFFMTASTIIVVINAMTLRKTRLEVVSDR